MAVCVEWPTVVGLALSGLIAHSSRVEEAWKGLSASQAENPVQHFLNGY